MQMGKETPESIMNSIDLCPEINPQEPSIHAGSATLVPGLRVQALYPGFEFGVQNGYKGRNPIG